jgi:dimeric dUTPase (all-alpha-NTP-PPase superfamily)
MKKQIKEMFNLQNNLNINTNGINWSTDKKTTEGRDIVWERAIHMECSEAIDSLPWKHWKDINGQSDIENLKIELVDIWHFIMSIIIEAEASYSNNTVDFDYVTEQWEKFNLITFDPISTVKSIEKLSLQALLITGLKDELEIFPNIDRSNYINVIYNKLLPCFINSCESVNLSFKELYSLYLGKNILNLFRQSHGYKNGTYIKMWNGKEDNVIMTNHLKSLLSSNDLTSDNLLELLEVEYDKVINA